MPVKEEAIGSIIDVLEKMKLSLPDDMQWLLANAPEIKIFNTTEELAGASTNNQDRFEVKYTLNNGREIKEAVIDRVSNGISVNYPESYMRRRDPDTMTIADDRPSDKERFESKYGYSFRELKEETRSWLGRQKLGMFFFFAGRDDIGTGGIAIGPSNAAFFLMGLSMLQRIVSLKELPDSFEISSIIYIAPPFRHSHFDGKQSVVHLRSASLHEIYAYNLYPGPSAKKGLYGVLISKGEKEGWVTTHCSTVQVVSPYDNITTFMHEGASGGGKSEMLQHIVREPEGQVLIGRNIITKEERKISIPTFCSFYPVTDDMAMCHPSLQKDRGKLTVLDAENAWFIRVDGIKEYGDDPFLEKISINPQKPLQFLNIKSKPGCTALLWDHIEDNPGEKCPNPRVIVPREIVPGIVDGPVTVDIRSFGVRTPPSCLENPDYGILGLFHILPPALAWLWRLVSPRGFANPSIIGSDKMESEGVGSYWPFATGRYITQANLLLEQIINSPRLRYVLVPNQHIGVWNVGFKPQLLMREYLTRRGNASLKPGQYQEARCRLLGYELNYLTIEGAKIPSRFLKVYRQPELGEEGYDLGAGKLEQFFEYELKKYLVDDISHTGRKIIEEFLRGAGPGELEKIIPMNYGYSFQSVADIERRNA